MQTFLTNAIFPDRDKEHRFPCQFVTVNRIFRFPPTFLRLQWELICFFCFKRMFWVRRGASSSVPMNTNTRHTSTKIEKMLFSKLRIQFIVSSFKNSIESVHVRGIEISWNKNYGHKKYDRMKYVYLPYGEIKLDKQHLSVRPPHQLWPLQEMGIDEVYNCNTIEGLCRSKYSDKSRFFLYTELTRWRNFIAWPYTEDTPHYLNYIASPRRGTCVKATLQLQTGIAF